MFSLILASSSPRRRQLLEQAGYSFSTSSVKVSEIPQENLNLSEQIEDIARRKALAFVQSGKLLNSERVLVLSADTVVVLDGEILGKPQDVSQSLVYLKRLSEKKHEVITAVSLIEADSKRDILREVNFHEVTQVEFRKLSEEEMVSYAESRDGLDKAGGYGIQGEARKFVCDIQGSLNNVIGLPTEKLQEVLKENGWNIDQKKL